MKRYLTIFISTFFLISSYAQNSALSFDGTEEYLTISHNNSYNIGTGFTIEAWILANQWRQQQWQGSIVAKDNQGPDRGFSFRCGNNGILSFVMSVGNVWQEVFTSPIMNANQWHHVAVVVDNGNMKLYVDGQQAATNSFTGTASHGNDLDINIGGSPGFGGRNFDGVIDEVRIWDIARSQADLQSTITSDLNGNEAGLVGYFPMNEGMGSIANDQSPTQNNASFNFMDNSNWVNGYSVPDYDVALKGLFGIDVVNMIDRPIKLSAVVQNTGGQAISDVDLKVKINGNLYQTERINQSIPAGDTFNYEFVLPLNLIGLTDPEISVEAQQIDDSNALNNIRSLTVKTGTSTKVIVKDKVLHKNGENFNSNKVTLPQDLHKYEQVLLNIDLTCPSGGCGPWDVLANLVAVTSSGSYELARYITPYGIACGGWIVDITDFKSVLGGEVDFQTTIDVFTAKGWLLDMSVDLIDNNPTDTYSYLSRLWELPFQVYGDPGISYDLPAIPVKIKGNTTSNHVRMTITGHGQGNTNNAAEFFNVNHQFTIDGTTHDTHNLWKADCAQNPCANQQGSWLFPRAGWCPGQSVDPYIINTSSQLNPGDSLPLDYVLQPYTNLLNTGYNNSSHTEPYYKIFSYFIESSPTPYRDYKNLENHAATGFVSNSALDSVTVSIVNNGFEAISNYEVKIFYNKQLVDIQAFSDPVAAGDTLTKQVILNSPQAIDTLISNSIFVEVASNTDDNPGDNILLSSLPKSTGSVGNEEIFDQFSFSIFPNPSQDGNFMAQYDKFWSGSTLRIYSLNGKLLQQIKLGKASQKFRIEGSGMYLYTISNSDGTSSGSGKIVNLR
ncbi:MAG: LamG domain-containing protein [Bacteroidia bacterium]|nr:LamG domain-containing protein [Bacteroidia bacterium]